MQVLPDSLEKFYFHDNAFNGSIDLSGFARTESNIKYIIGDNNAFSGDLDLRYITNTMLEYIWLWSNELTSTTLSMDVFNSTSLKQLILSNNKLNDTIDLSSMSTSLPNIDILFIEHNLFQNEDELDFSDIPANTTLRIDEYISCDTSLYCTNDAFNCSFTRNNITCTGPSQCAATCVCQFSNNCTKYNEDTAMEYYDDYNFTKDYHRIIPSIDLNGDQNMNDLWLLSMIDISSILPINSTSLSTAPPNKPSTTSTNQEESPLEKIFGSKELAYCVIIAGFIVLMLCIYGIFRCIKSHKKKHSTKSIVHDKNKDSTDDAGRKSWAQNKGKAVVIRSVSNVNMVASDDEADPDSPKSKSGSGSGSALNMKTSINDIDDGTGLATKFLNLQPIQKNKIPAMNTFRKAASNSYDETDGEDAAKHNRINAVSQSQPQMMQQMMDDPVQQQMIQMQQVNMWMMNNMMMMNAMAAQMSPQQQQNALQMMQMGTNMNLQHVQQSPDAGDLGNPVMQQSPNSQSVANVDVSNVAEPPNIEMVNVQIVENTNISNNDQGEELEPGQVKSIDSKQEMPGNPLLDDANTKDGNTVCADSPRQSNGSHMANLADIAIQIEVNKTSAADSSVGGHARHETQETMSIPMLPEELSHDIDDDVYDGPIGPFAQRGADELPQLPDEDMDTDDGPNTDTEEVNRDMFGSYKSPGGVIQTLGTV